MHGHQLYVCGDVGKFLDGATSLCASKLLLKVSIVSLEVKVSIEVKVKLSKVKCRKSDSVFSNSSTFMCIFS